MNYTETFSAAAKMLTVCVVLGNTAEEDWEIEHINIKSAYLNAPLKETIYMKPPQGVLKPGQEGKVCHLLKGLYGLKQAGDMNQSLLHVYNVPTILDAWALIAYQQILASRRTLRPCQCVECVWAHISDLYYGRG